MKDYSNTSPEFADKIKLLETTDTNHADNFNYATRILFDNTMFLKNQAGTPPEYDPETPFSPGDVVTHEGATYKCTVKIEEGEEWDPAHWQEINLLSEMEVSLQHTAEILRKVDILVNNLVPLDKPVYGFIVHETTDQDPESRVEYIGANKNFRPMKMNKETHVMDLGDWGSFDYLKGMVPVMANFDGGIDYYLNPDNYAQKADGTESNVSDATYNGNAMFVIPKAYTWEYKLAGDRYVLISERKLTDDFEAQGFNVLGKERPYMLGPMFYGSIDDQGRLRSLAGQMCYGTASGAQADVAEDAPFKEKLGVTAGITTDIQWKAIQNTSKNGLFFGGPITNFLANLCILISKSTNSQEAFGGGMSGAYVNDKAQAYGTKKNEVVNGGMFWGSSDNKSFNKIFHSAVLGSYMVWQRDPYMVLSSGRIKVSTDYTYDPTGEKYLDTGIDFKPGDTNPHYYPTYNVVKGYGAVPCADMKDKATSATGYCDATWANAEGVRVSLRLGDVYYGAGDGLWARSLADVATGAWWGLGASLLLPAPAAA